MGETGAEPEREGEKEGDRTAVGQRQAETKQRGNKEEMTREKRVKRKKGRRGGKEREPVALEVQGLRGLLRDPCGAPDTAQAHNSYPECVGMGCSPIPPVDPVNRPTAGNENS